MHPPRPWLLAVLPLFLAVGTARADDPPPVLMVGSATVIASPGVPSAMDAFLPGSPPRRPIAWPLPEGPVIALGLPAQDPAARGLADLLQLDVDDLDGGYRIFAWHDGHRPLVIVMAADSAALLAARFEFEAQAPAGMADPSMRSLDFKKPNEQAEIAVRGGTRTVRPRYAYRAWDPEGGENEWDPSLAEGARANRFWVTGGFPPGNQAILCRVLRDEGVVPVVRETIAGRIRDDTVAARAKATAASLRRWQKAAGARHFALVFDAAPADVRAEGAAGRDHEHAIARYVADQLRPGGLEELTVVPRCHSDRLAAAIAPPPDLTDVPEALVAWSGPDGLSLQVSRAAAARRVAHAGGTPVLLLETWAAPFQGRGQAAYVPTLPRGRAADLGDVLAGVVVVGRRGGPAATAELWQPAGDTRFGTALAADLLALNPPQDSLEAWLSITAYEARAAAREHGSLAAWLTPWAEELLAAAAEARTRDGIRVPLVPEPIHADGRLDERPWAFARSLVKNVDGVSALALSDGHALRLGVRIDAKVVGKRPFVLQIQVGTHGRTGVWHVRLTPEGAEVEISDQGEGAARIPAHHVAAEVRQDARGTSAEITFDRFALGGEPHLGRVLDASITWGPRRLWPAAPGRGVLFVTR